MPNTTAIIPRNLQSQIQPFNLLFSPSVPAPKTQWAAYVGSILRNHRHTPKMHAALFCITSFREVGNPIILQNKLYASYTSPKCQSNSYKTKKSINEWQFSQLKQTQYQCVLYVSMRIIAQLSIILVLFIHCYSFSLIF